MSEPCEAILERRAISTNRASLHGAKNGCIYCAARHSPPLSVGEKIAVLNGPDAAARFHVGVSTIPGEFLGSDLDSSAAGSGGRRLGLKGELYGKLPLNTPPFWAPPFSLRDSFILDELAVWVCGRAMETENFVWNDDDIDECIAIMWEKRLPIMATELVAVLAAHGLPTTLHNRFASRFVDGIRLLCRVKGRPAIRKKRLESFDDVDADPKGWFDKYILPGLPLQLTTPPSPGAPSPAPPRSP